MRITTHTIAAIQEERQRRGLNQSQLADLLGLDRSTVSKMLGGQIETMRPEIVDAFNDKLGLELEPPRVNDKAVCPAAVALSEMADTDPAVAKLLPSLMSALRARCPKVPFMPDIPTAKLEKVGAAMTRIVHQWEQAKDPHYAKIGGESLDWIRGFYRDEFKPGK